MLQNIREKGNGNHFQNSKLSKITIQNNKKIGRKIEEKLSVAII